MKPKITATFHGDAVRERTRIGYRPVQAWLVEYDGGTYQTDDWRDAVCHALASGLPWDEAEQAARRQYQHVGFRCTWPIPMRLGVTLIEAGAGQTGARDGG